MKTFSTILVLFWSTLITFAQSPQAFLDSILDHTKTASVYRNSVDWKQLETEINDLAAGADSVSKLAPALNHMLSALGDNHGRIIYQGQYLAYYSGDSPENREAVDWDVYGQIQNGQTFPFLTQMMENKVGYVRIVGLPMGDNEAMSLSIQNAVCELIDAGAKDWIVDLRYNGGGNMFPMVEGLAPLIGDGKVGGTVGTDPEEKSEWNIQNGDFYYDDYTVGLKNDCPPGEAPKIAVLTSRYTASSGEALAVILKERPDTRFFGENTYGLITVTDWKPISEDLFVSISVAYYQDREGKVYNELVDVDEVVPLTLDPLSPEDLGAKHAMEWLNSN